jgi:uncharacterized SAM-binding protein YcdF (DUF218 family)
MDAILSILAELAKALFIPGSVPFLLLALTVGVVLLLMDETRRARGRGLLAGLAVLYWVLSLPITAATLEKLVAGDFGPIQSVNEAEGARSVVVLGGGGLTLRSGSEAIDLVSDSTAYRILEAQRLYELLDGPTLVLSGGPPPTLPDGRAESEAMRDLLVARGVDPGDILVETESGNTHDQALLVRGMLTGESAQNFVLVTSPIHMRRAVGTFTEVGLHPVPSAGPEGEGRGHVGRFLPSEEGLRRSQTVMREIIALLYYYARGWLGPA